MPQSRAIVAALVVPAAGVLCWAYLSHRDSGQDAIPVIRSSSMRPEPVASAFAGVGSVSAEPGIRMLLVNHHLLAPHFIASAVARAATSRPVTVILISPDHFNRGPTWATTASARWETPFGNLETDEAAVAALTGAGASVRPAVIEREHGITNITMFIAHAMPQARMVPLAIKDEAPDDIVFRLTDALVGIRGEVLIVGSFDFTHDSTAMQARANDATSIEVLRSSDARHSSSVAVDSHAGIHLLLSYAERIGAQFTLLARSDSAEVLGQPGRTDVTSYITGYWVSR